MTHEGRADLLGVLQELPLTEVVVTVEGVELLADAFTFEGSTFASMTDVDVLISIAAPTPIVAEGFTTEID